MIIQVCPSCGGRLTAHVFDNYVEIKCNACGQELGSFTRADYPLIIKDKWIYPINDFDCNMKGGEISC